MSQTSHARRAILWFLIGTVLSAVGFGAYAVFLQNTIHDLRASQQSAAQNVDSQTAAHLREVQGQLQDVTQQRDACQQKFERRTFLYEQAILAGPSREWMIPADVEPVYVGTRRGVFSHYDPKTQMETVKFDAKTK